MDADKIEHEEMAMEQKAAKGTKEFCELVGDVFYDIRFNQFPSYGAHNPVDQAKAMDRLRNMIELHKCMPLENGRHGTNYTNVLLVRVLEAMASSKTPLHLFKGFRVDALIRVCDLLRKKNASYGDTALKPIGIFARGSALDLIDVRIDDKLSRLLTKPDAFGEDVLLDLAGYLVLRLIALREGVAHG